MRGRRRSHRQYSGRSSSGRLAITAAVRRSDRSDSDGFGAGEPRAGACLEPARPLRARPANAGGQCGPMICVPPRVLARFLAAACRFCSGSAGGGSAPLRLARRQALVGDQQPRSTAAARSRGGRPLDSNGGPCQPRPSSRTGLWPANLNFGTRKLRS